MHASQGFRNSSSREGLCQQLVKEEHSCLRLLYVPRLVGRCALFHSKIDEMNLASQAGRSRYPDQSMYRTFSASEAKMEATELPENLKGPSPS